MISTGNVSPRRTEAASRVEIGQTAHAASAAATGAALSFLGRALELNAAAKLSPVPEFFRMAGRAASGNHPEIRLHPAFSALFENPGERTGETLTTNKSKVLTLMAVLHDPRCVNPNNGEVRPTYTQSVIDSLGRQHGLRTQDVTVGEGVVFSPNDDTLTFPGEPPLALAGMSSRVIAAREAAMARQPKALAADLNTLVPKRDPAIGELQELALGDMHGNVQLLLFQLVAAGVLKINNEDIWLQCMSALQGSSKHTPFGPGGQSVASLDDRAAESLKANAEQFKFLLSRAVAAGDNAAAGLVLLGDLLNDRGHNDFCMLSAIGVLRNKGIDTTVIVSNHDVEFLRIYDRVKSLPATESWGSKVKEMNNSGVLRLKHDSLDSMIAMMDHGDAEERLLYRNVLIDMVENTYLKATKMLACSRDDAAYYTHGAGLRLVTDANERNAGVADDSISFGDKVTMINQTCLPVALESTDAFDRTFLTAEGHNQMSMDNRTEENFNADLLAATALVWGHGVSGHGAARVDQLYSRLSDDFALADQFRRNIHGHTPYGPDETLCLDVLREQIQELPGVMAQQGHPATVEAFVRNYLDNADRLDGKVLLDALGLLMRAMQSTGAIVGEDAPGEAVITHLSQRLNVGVSDNVAKYLRLFDLESERINEAFRDGGTHADEIGKVLKDFDRMPSGGFSLFEINFAVDRFVGLALKHGLIQQGSDETQPTSFSKQLEAKGFSFSETTATALDALQGQRASDAGVIDAQNCLSADVEARNVMRTRFANLDKMRFYNSLDGNKGKLVFETDHEGRQTKVAKRIKNEDVPNDSGPSPVGYFAYEKVALERQVFAIPAGVPISFYQ